MTNSYQKPPTRFFTDITFTPPEVVKLNNGIKLQIIGDGEDEVNKLAVYFPGGSYEESVPLLSGISVTALFEGNDRNSAAEIAEALDFCGATRQSSIHDHHTSVTLSSLNYNFAQTCELFYRCTCHPTFPQSGIEIITKRLASQCRTMLQEVSSLADNEMSRLYYGKGHPLARIPTPSGIESITHEDIATHHSLFHYPDECRIIISGHITDKELKILDETFGRWQVNGAHGSILPDAEPTPAIGKTSIVTKKDAVQNAIKLRIPAIPRTHPHYIPLRTLTIALGGYFGSRLMKNIREKKGLTYGISASLSGRRSEGHINIETECDATYTAQVIDEIKYEMERLRNSPIRHDELQKVKQFVISSLTRVLDTPTARADYASTDFLYGTGADYFNRQVKVISDITPDTLQEMAQLYLSPDNMLCVIAGNM